MQEMSVDQPTKTTACKSLMCLQVRIESPFHRPDVVFEYPNGPS